MTNNYNYNFNKLFEMFLNDEVLSEKTYSDFSTKYPHYNLYYDYNDNPVLEFAVAGYRKDDLTVEMEDNVLIVKGCVDNNDTDNNSDDKKYSHRGIALRNFTVKRNVPNYFEVDGIALENGILSIKFKNVKQPPKVLKINTK